MPRVNNVAQYLVKDKRKTPVVHDVVPALSSSTNTQDKGQKVLGKMEMKFNPCNCLSDFGNPGKTTVRLSGSGLLIVSPIYYSGATFLSVGLLLTEIRPIVEEYL